MVFIEGCLTPLSYWETAIWLNFKIFPISV